MQTHGSAKPISGNQTHAHNQPLASSMYTPVILNRAGLYDICQSQYDNIENIIVQIHTTIWIYMYIKQPFFWKKVDS